MNIIGTKRIPMEKIDLFDEGGHMNIRCEMCDKITSSKAWKENNDICPFCNIKPIKQYQVNVAILEMKNALLSVSNSLETLAKWCMENWIR
jgi:hypothetical protein